MATVSLTHVSKVYYSRAYPDGLRVLDDVNFAVQDREFLCLLGPSGCGKSTVLNLLSGLDTSYSGTIAIDGKDLRRPGGSDTRVGYVFQDARLLPWLTVRANLNFALECVGVPRDEWRDRTDPWLERVGLAGFADSHPHELSGGMRQRAAIARAFVVDPDILLMDEPFSGLDELTARTMREHLLELWSEARKTVIFVTHNCFEACYLADRLLVMSARPGKIRYEQRVELPRPRNYDSTELFELSVAVTQHLIGFRHDPMREQAAVG